LARALESERIGVAGPVVTYYDDPERIWSAGGYVHPSLGYTRHHAFNERSAPDSARAVDFVSGCAIAIRRDLAQHLGGFDAAYFHYFEDADLCARVRVAGIDCVVEPTAVVAHKVSASAGERGSNRMNAVQAYYFTRNRVRFVRRTFTSARRITAMTAQPLLVLYEMAKDARDRSVSAARARVRGLVDGFRGAQGRSS
jgi:GT2 family glycosyltransferase